MAKPRVFVSSTFIDLKYVRAALEQFIESLGYDAVLSERGDIPYLSDIALDKSCYEAAAAADIFVLIIGGRYGSKASNDTAELPTNEREKFFAAYESITRSEYKAAVDHDIPIYILIEKRVHAEYDTFRQNRENESIKYAHVDSVNVFKFIDEVYGQNRNNAAFDFDEQNDITEWLRIQWAGLFRDMLSKKSQERQIATMADQVDGLKQVTGTLQKYLELIMEKVDVPDAQTVIENEKRRLLKEQQISELTKLLPKSPLLQALTNNGVTSDKLLEVVQADTVKSFVDMLILLIPESGIGQNILSGYELYKNIKGKFKAGSATPEDESLMSSARCNLVTQLVTEINAARKTLDIPELPPVV